MLSVIDQHWREHLYEMDYLREGINLRAMGQQDPLAEWQREGFDMFEAMMEAHQGRLRPVHLPARGRAPTTRPRRPAKPAATRRPRTRCRGAAASRRGRGRGADRGARRRGRRPWIVEDAGPQQPVQVEKLPGPQRALLLRERQEVQAVPRPLSGRQPRLMRDFTDDLSPCAHASTRRGLPPHRRRNGRGSSSSRPRRRGPTSGTTRTRPARSRVSSRGVRDDVELSTGSTSGSTTSTRCTSSGARSPTSRSSPRSRPGSSRCAASSTGSSSARCSPASTTNATRSAR